MGYKFKIYDNYTSFFAKANNISDLVKIIHSVKYTFQ